MSQQVEKQVLIRLKKRPCPQQNCLSNNQDNVELIVFNTDKAKKTGLMCSQCFVDSQLLQGLLPVQKYVLSIKKYLRILTNFHKQYAALKQSPQWIPTIIGKQSESLRRKTQIFYDQNLKYALQIVHYVDTTTKKAYDNLKKINQDKDFDKINQYINEENMQQQERMMISVQLNNICKLIKVVEGKHKYATEDKIKKQTQEIVSQYRKNIAKATTTLRDLLQTQRQCLRGLLS